MTRLPVRIVALILAVCLTADSSATQQTLARPAVWRAAAVPQFPFTSQALASRPSAMDGQPKVLVAQRAGDLAAQVISEGEAEGGNPSPARKRTHMFYPKKKAPAPEGARLAVPAQIFSRAEALNDKFHAYLALASNDEMGLVRSLKNQKLTEVDLLALTQVLVVHPFAESGALPALIAALQRNWGPISAETLSQIQANLQQAMDEGNLTPRQSSQIRTFIPPSAIAPESDLGRLYGKLMVGSADDKAEARRMATSRAPGDIPDSEMTAFFRRPLALAIAGAPLAAKPELAVWAAAAAEKCVALTMDAHPTVFVKDAALPIADEALRQGLREEIRLWIREAAHPTTGRTLTQALVYHLSSAWTEDSTQELEDIFQVLIGMHAKHNEDVLSGNKPGAAAISGGFGDPLDDRLIDLLVSFGIPNDRDQQVLAASLMGIFGNTIPAAEYEDLERLGERVHEVGLSINPHRLNDFFKKHQGKPGIFQDDFPPFLNRIASSEGLSLRAAATHRKASPRRKSLPLTDEPITAMAAAAALDPKIPTPPKIREVLQQLWDNEIPELLVEAAADGCATVTLGHKFEVTLSGLQPGAGYRIQPFRIDGVGLCLFLENKSLQSVRGYVVRIVWGESENQVSEKWLSETARLAEARAALFEAWLNVPALNLIRLVNPAAHRSLMQAALDNPSVRQEWRVLDGSIRATISELSLPGGIDLILEIAKRIYAGAALPNAMIAASIQPGNDFRTFYTLWSSRLLPRLREIAHESHSRLISASA